MMKKIAAVAGFSAAAWAVYHFYPDFYRYMKIRSL
jgi:hypothetical protein